MSYDAYQTLLLRQQNQLIHDQTNLMRSAAGLPPAAPLGTSRSRSRRPTQTVAQRNREGFAVLAVLAAVVLGLVGLVGWGIVEVLALLLA